MSLQAELDEALQLALESTTIAQAQ